ncbi:hypothetical protein BDK51DRAFT_37525 [Blyttiomyces helicus]|uniref:Uncharacterized protein n=1 Tax=Blyttiomyces helicus TaxID=388810 RepID=A0A4P9WFM7_9FUNG|nr:hypothetical protein BDK51DRAFT_37525 [Blyttiomyces helicus]|eukprot:RKO91571.1 hypothetical protein BDK51DRAFT_37525 [Blyttiomyces helicus]
MLLLALQYDFSYCLKMFLTASIMFWKCIPRAEIPKVTNFRTSLNAGGMVKALHRESSLPIAIFALGAPSAEGLFAAMRHLALVHGLNRESFTGSSKRTADIIEQYHGTPTDTVTEHKVNEIHDLYMAAKDADIRKQLPTLKWNEIDVRCVDASAGEGDVVGPVVEELAGGRCGEAAQNGGRREAELVSDDQLVIAECRLEDADHAFRTTVCTLMAGSGYGDVSATQRNQLGPELGGHERVAVGNGVVGQAVKAHHIVHEGVGEIRNLILGVTQNEMGLIRKAAEDDDNAVKAVGGGASR